MKNKPVYLRRHNRRPLQPFFFFFFLFFEHRDLVVLVVTIFAESFTLAAVVRTG